MCNFFTKKILFKLRSLISLQITLAAVIFSNWLFHRKSRVFSFHSKLSINDFIVTRIFLKECISNLVLIKCNNPMANLEHFPVLRLLSNSSSLMNHKPEEIFIQSKFYNLYIKAF